MHVCYNGALLACKNVFAESKLCCLVACKYCNQWKSAASRLSYSAGFLRQLAGKLVGRGKCGPNPRKVGHLVCLVSDWANGNGTDTKVYIPLLLPCALPSLWVLWSTQFTMTLPSIPLGLQLTQMASGVTQELLGAASINTH